MENVRRDYLPIAEHGIIGDLHSIALVGTDARIDWYCCPRFDSPSVFGSILDKDRGGYYRISPVDEEWVPKQLYLPDTNVLITRFLTGGGVGEVQDFMPIQTGIGPHRHRLIRRVLGVRGEMRFRVEVFPRFNFARDEHETIFHENGVLFRSPGLSLALETAIPLDFRDEGAYGEFTLLPGETAAFVLEQVPETYVPRSFSEGETREAFEQTAEYWRRWLAQSNYSGRWREMLHRSALTLKLMTYQPTGAIVAAPTTSLPEHIGGGRNWDYRYTWIRDAAFSLYALLRLGFTEEAAGFMDWLRERFREQRAGATGPLQIMYGIDGRAELTEEILEHLEGYRGSAPVRIGNGAAEQLQLDIYGELVDSVYLYNQWGADIHHDAWEDLTRVVDWVCANWDQADEGIWEVRGGRKDFTYSRLMCWVAIERAIRLAARRGPACGRDRLAGGARRDLPPDHEPRLERGAAGVRAALRHGRARRRRARDAALPLRRPDRSPLAGDARRDHGRARLATASSTATTSRRRPTGSRARRARSRSAASGTSRRSPGPGEWTRRGSRSRRCSRTRITSGCTPSRSARPARRSATSRRRSPTWR